MMMAQTLFKLLKAQDPRCHISVLALSWTRPLLDAMPEVDAVIDMPIGHGPFAFLERRRIGLSLRSYGFDQAILLPNSFKSALIPYFANIPKRTGWLGEMRYGLLNDHRKLDKSAYPLMVERYAALAFPKHAKLPTLPNPSLQVNAENLGDLLASLALNLERPVLILCPGAEYGIAKRWPQTYYAEVAEAYIARGYQVWSLGGKNDIAVGDDIRAALSVEAQLHYRNIAGQTQLSEAILLMAQAERVLSNDSGLMHIAAALNKPLAVVFGSTSPEHTPPLGERVAIVQQPIDCSPCFKRECPFGHYRCLTDVKPDAVIAAMDSLT